MKAEKNPAMGQGNVEMRKGNKENWRTEVLTAGALMVFAFLVNQGIRLSGLFMDDLYLWYCYWEQSFLQYVFPVGSTRFRFIHYLAAYLEQTLVGTHIGWLVPINIVLNGVIAYGIYRFGRRLAGRMLPGFLCGVLYLSSRMSYYQISQVNGLMETMALAEALGLLYFVYRFVNGQGEKRYFWYANALYFLVCFTHERYMLLFPVLVLALLFGGGRVERGKRPALWGGMAGCLAAVLLIRLLALGTLAPAGTGGTDVADTFHLGQAVKFALSQALYLFGVNAGPEHLNGLPWTAAPPWLKLLTAASALILAAAALLFIREFLKASKRRWEIMKNVILFLVFIAMCIGSSSVTVRVEMRWVYISYVAALLFFAYFCGVSAPARNLEGEERPLKGTGGRRVRGDHRAVFSILFILYAALTLPAEIYYRGHFDRLYLWPEQARYNSLADETRGRYGESLAGKQIYVIGNSYEVSDFTARTFFRIFDPEIMEKGTTVTFAEGIRDFGQVKENMIVLREDPGHNGYQDVTDFVRSLKCGIAYGYYRDGWMDEEAKITVMAGASGIIQLELLYPGQISGGEETRILVGGERTVTIPVKENITRATIEVSPYESVELEFSNNYFMQDAQEQRGEKRLSAIVNIEAD